MSKQRIRNALATGLLAVGASGLVSCASTSTADEPAPSSAVALDPDHAPSSAALGVVVSLTSAPGEGADWSRAAEGAVVAAERFALGGHDITLVAQNDKGTEAGATAAVEALIEQRVSGIVLASDGSHLTGALETAAEAGIPVLLPYAAPADLPDGVWSITPSHEQVSAALEQQLRAQDLRSPLVVDAGGEVLSGITPVETLTFDPGSDAVQLAKTIAKRVRKGAAVDSVVIAGPAEAQATVVSALQGRDAALPVVLTPQALSPQFAASLEEAGGSNEANLLTVGTSGGDASTLDPGGSGAASAAFYAALRMVSDDGGRKDFFDGQPFSSVAHAADGRSHDAVVALVTAMARARSTEAAEVGKALSDLSLSQGEGLAGPDLDFRETPVVSSEDVTALQSTSQDPGVRPASGVTSQIFWFPPPAA